ncbi:hypothetical protein ACNAN0_12910 [Agrilactobacillus fermenti]|uniref:hypothetical protein n=1 Tax=Agrilactobacillus fermenti TaxID=2586909 RepID=UPI003A5BAE31
MNYLYKPMFRIMYKKKETKLLLAFCAFPLMLILVDMFDTNFMQLSAPKGSMSFLEFFGAVTNVQYQLTLPAIALIYLTTTCIHDEISSSVIYLFKDIKRSKILNAKIAALVSIYLSSFVALFFTSLITYYGYLKNLAYTSGTFFPSHSSDLKYVIVTISGILCMSILIVILSTAMSIKFNNGVTILVSVVFALVSYIAPRLQSLRYVFPNGYGQLYGRLGFGIAMFLILGLFIAYSAIFYVFATRQFEKIDL